MISATIVGDSINECGHRITSFELVYPRAIHSEILTHRMFSKNSASSRAIPVKKMIESIKTNMFIPRHIQKSHSGMQGTEYLEGDQLEDIQDLWIKQAESALRTAEEMNKQGVSKQIINRILEPFQYYKILLTATEFYNFFELRSPQYDFEVEGVNYKSKDEWLDEWSVHFGTGEMDALSEKSEEWWLKKNKGQAEIHVMELAEKMYDAMNESTPKLLQPGQWHIPYGDKIDLDWLKQSYEGKINEDFFNYDSGLSTWKPWVLEKLLIKISTGMAARTSYTTVGGEKEISFDTLVGIHDKMKNQKPFHASPFEHSSRAMGVTSLRDYSKTYLIKNPSKYLLEEVKMGYSKLELLTDGIYKVTEYGWDRNFRGFSQYRSLLENGLI